MAECFKEADVRDSEYKQIKRYLTKYCCMNNDLAQANADKINLACRVYKHHIVGPKRGF